MERVLLDTDIFSVILRRRDPNVVRTAEAYLAVHAGFTLSVVTVAEIFDGYRRRGLDSHIESFVGRLDTEGHVVLPLDLEAAKLAGLMLGDLHRTGQPVGRADPFIAAIAVQAGIPLVTGNTSHFERLQALGYPLLLQNWRIVVR